MATPKTPPGLRLFDPVSPIQRQILLQQNIKKSRDSALWGTINIALLCIILYDLNNTCFVVPGYTQYFEYFLVIVFTCNAAYHIFKYIRTYPFPCPEKENVRVQSSKINQNDSTDSVYQNIVNSSFSKTPMDMSAASWLSSTSFNESISAPSWIYQNGTPIQSMSPNYGSTPIIVPNAKQELDNEESLTQYLKDYSALETSQNISITEKPMNTLSFFWNHPSTKINKEASPLLTRCQYQLSPTSLSSSPKADDKGSPLNKSGGLDTWKRLNVDSVALTQWNENLRIWLSQTILCRLITEIANIDKSLHSLGMHDISIGAVGLDRLRKTVTQNTPNLQIIVQFLELHPNQEYLVKRIKELAKGGCMSEYKWNGGSSYNGKDWDVSLPSDAAIVMHLTATYLDTQLIPLPNKPDIKPFSGYHFVKATEKLPELTDDTLAIHEVTVNPPHYRVIIGRDTLELVKGYNNLFHSILLFLYQVNKKEHGMLGRVNLGPAGVNMLWIIQSN